MSKRIVILGSGLAAGCVIAGLRSSVHSLYFDKQANPAFADEKHGDIQDLAQLDVIRPDLVVLAGYQPIVPQHYIEKFRIINLHPSLLPAYRGMHSVVWAMLNGESLVGLTLHEVDALVDNGPIIWQGKEEVAQHSAYRLLELLHQQFEACAADVIDGYLYGRIAAVPQNFDDATFVGRRRMEDCRIDFGQSNDYLRRFFQALQKPYPLPFFSYNGANYSVTKVSVVDKHYRERNGLVVYKDLESIWVKTADGVLRIMEVQDADDRLHNPAAFVKTFARL
jgi:methionyl-tRNA formyltransferase